MVTALWDYDGFIGKAQEYFRRAAEHEHSDDDEFAMWHLLGFEFLLRAPLARIHASLLAVAEGDSILAANGIPTNSDPRSIVSSIVVARLTKVVPGFAGDAERDSLVLMNLRNAELHSSHAAVSDAGNEFWLPKLVRVARMICEHLGLDISDVLDSEVVTLGDGLLDQADKKIQHQVAVKVETARSFLRRLSPEELNARVAAAEPSSVLDRLMRERDTTRVQCPACNTLIYVPKTYVRSTRERLKGDAVVRDEIYFLDVLECPVCGLELTGAAELVAAGLAQQVTIEEKESLEDRYEPEGEYEGAEYMDE